MQCAVPEYVTMKIISLKVNGDLRMRLKVIFELLVPSSYWQNPRNSKPESFLNYSSFDARETPEILMELHQTQTEPGPQNLVLLKRKCQDKFLEIAFYNKNSVIPATRLPYPKHVALIYLSLKYPKHLNSCKFCLA